MNIKREKIWAKFFIAEGDITILVGNDILEPLGSLTYTETGVIKFARGTDDDNYEI